MSTHSAKMQCAAGHGGITKKELTRNTGILTFNLKEAAKLLRRKKTRQPYIMYYRSVLHRPAESPKMNVSCLQLHFLEGGWCRWWCACFNGPYSKSENYFLHIIGTSLFATGILPKEIEVDVIVFCPLAVYF